MKPMGGCSNGPDIPEDFRASHPHPGTRASPTTQLVNQEGGVARHAHRSGRGLLVLAAVIYVLGPRPGMRQSEDQLLAPPVGDKAPV